MPADSLPSASKAIIRMRSGACDCPEIYAGQRKKAFAMMDTDLAQSLQATVLAALLESTGTAPKLTAYRGALTPQQLDAPERETAALISEAAIHDLGWLRRIAVRGEDRFRWLSGMVTNTVNDLFPNSGAWNFVLNAQGHIQGDLTVWRGGEELSPQRRKTEAPGGRKSTESAGDPLLGTPFAGESGLELEIAADQFDKLLTHLNQFIIMDDVELVPLGMEAPGEAGAETAIGLSGPLAVDVLGRLSLPGLPHPMSGAQLEWNGFDLRLVRTHGTLVPHYELWLPVAGLPLLWSALRTAGATPIGSATLNAFRVAEAIPLYGIDILERDLPQETSQSRALHFNKGCYLGQEIVERIRSRGNVHRHLRPLEIDGPFPASGTELALSDGSAAGVIRSAATLPLAADGRTFALGMIRAEAEERDEPFAYTVDGVKGLARVLTVPPNLQRNS
jgi:folate-binding protein YgfZ